jgi:hypothetical protein
MGTITGPKENQIQKASPIRRPGGVTQVSATPGEVFLVETTTPKGTKSVDVVLHFGGNATFVFPKEMRALMQKEMQRASDPVVEAVSARSKLVPAMAPTPQAASVVTSTVPVQETVQVQEQPETTDVPNPSSVDVMP